MALVAAAVSDRPSTLADRVGSQALPSECMHGAVPEADTAGNERSASSGNADIVAARVVVLGETLVSLPSSSLWWELILRFLHPWKIAMLCCRCLATMLKLAAQATYGYPV